LVSGGHSPGPSDKYPVHTFRSFLTERTSPAAMQAIADCLKVLKDHATTNVRERGIIIDLRTGERIFDDLGTSERVKIPDVVKDPTKSLTLIHNHPPSGPHPMQYAAGPFSENDWNVFAQDGIQDMYVVSTDGTWRLHKTKDWQPIPGYALAATLHHALGIALDIALRQHHLASEADVSATPRHGHRPSGQLRTRPDGPRHDVHEGGVMLARGHGVEFPQSRVGIVERRITSTAHAVEVAAVVRVTTLRDVDAVHDRVLLRGEVTDPKTNTSVNLHRNRKCQCHLQMIPEVGIEIKATPSFQETSRDVHSLGILVSGGGVIIELSESLTETRSHLGTFERRTSDWKCGNFQSRMVTASVCRSLRVL
jgi:hypothetical protein